jgi:hypothetical protein
MEWHHRRRRRIKDEHQHCPCNGVWLCRDCHVWAHAHPEQAKAAGYILPGTVDRPSTVALLRSGTWWSAFPCDGDSVSVYESELAVLQAIPFHTVDLET